MSLPLIRSASRPLMRRAKGPSPMFTHSPPHALLQLLWKVQWQHFFSFFLSPSCVLSFFPSISHTHTLSLYISFSISVFPVWISSLYKHSLLTYRQPVCSAFNLSWPKFDLHLIKTQQLELHLSAVIMSWVVQRCAPLSASLCKASFDPTCWSQ